MPTSTIKANLLGDVRAEADSRMLDTAFYESPDYKTLVESPDRSIVVGRRGTGKSALAYKLSRHFSQFADTQVVQISPDEAEIIGLRPVTKLFGERFRLIRAGAQVSWRYALAMEIASQLRPRYKTKQQEAFQYLEPHLARWRVPDTSIAFRLKKVLRETIPKEVDPEETVGDLAKALELHQVEGRLRAILTESNTKVVLILDRLDEGYEPDDLGVALVDGLIHAAIDFRSRFESARAVLFLRDNIFRAVAQLDPDFSRNIEGQTLRLHWDEYSLLNLTANRIREALNIELEQSIKVWDRSAASGLEGKDGFRRCLRLTLYRPRDLLILLNDAFLRAAQQERSRIVPADIDSSAKAISTHRLDDLKKEYARVLPGLEALAEALVGQGPNLHVSDAAPLFESASNRKDIDQAAQQYFALTSSTEVYLKDLYSVGLVGIKDSASGNFVFSHDGRDPHFAFKSDDTILIHPCYWLALNTGSHDIPQELAQEVYDEYEIRVSSETPIRREKEIGALMAEEGQVPRGHAGWVEFEDWCLRAIQVLFAARLSNIVKNPNSGSLQRRDIVATNLGVSPFWKRMMEDYETRQVDFEVKNYDEITADDFRQMLSYSTKEYGKCIFVITRAFNENLKKGRELDWIRLLYRDHDRLIVKLSSKVLSNLLGKLRNPQKHDAGEKYMNGLLDQYQRMYLSHQATRT